MSLATIVVLALATYRCARLVSRDTLTMPMRDSLYAWAYSDRRGTPTPRAPWRTWVYELVTCPLCIGVWTGGAVYLLWRYGGTIINGLLVVLAIAGAQCALVLGLRDVDAD